MNALDAANHLSDLALLLELVDENQFKIRAISNAARVLENRPESVAELLTLLPEQPIKGIGPQIAKYLSELQTNGVIAEAGSIRAQFPATFFELFRVSGLGVKKAKALYRQLEVSSLPELIEACSNGRVAALKGFGQKTSDNFLQSARRCIENRSLFRIDVATREANQLLDHLRKHTGANSIELVGELRRGLEIIRGLKFLCHSIPEDKLIAAFVSYPNCSLLPQVAPGQLQTTLATGLPISCQLVARELFAAELLLQTGSTTHVEQLAKHVRTLGLELNAPSLSEVSNGSLEESDLFSAIRLTYLPPELREGNSELAQAREAFSQGIALPRLIELPDIQGVVHAHSTYSDGRHTLRELAEAVRTQGFAYLGISDHSKSAAYAGGLTEDEILRQHEEIDQLNDLLAPFHIFKGIESDILSDGSLDYSDQVLDSFDFVIASIHSGLSMSQSAMRKRMEIAIANPYTTFIGHPTARKLLERPEAAVEIPFVLEYAAAHGVGVEINSNPARLDLDWRFQSLAQSLGVLVPICPDAHSIEGIMDLKFGVTSARKGGLTIHDVPTAWGVAEISEFFTHRKGG